MPRLGHKKYDIGFPACTEARFRRRYNYRHALPKHLIEHKADRKGSLRSRLGCKQCKARHVKCDELKPCSNCTRHGVQCSLITWDPDAPQPQAAHPASISRQPSTDQSDTAPASTPSPSLPPIDYGSSQTTTSPREESKAASAFSEGSPAPSLDHFPFLTNFIHRPERSLSDLWLHDLELMHHWTVEAYETLSQREDMRQTWRVDTPKHAVVHSFLMHEILAFAALHKAYKEVDHRTEYYSFGIHHQDLAIRGIREKLHNVLPHEAVALVATSTLLTLSVFASTGFEFNLPEIATSQCPIDGILNIFSLMQGMGNVLAMAYMFVMGSFLAPMFKDANEPCASQPMLQELASHIPELITFIQGKRDLSEPERAAYVAVITQLEPVIQFAMSPCVDNRELRFLFYWPLHLDQGLLAYLRQRRPGALVVLMYYATMLYASESRYWFLEGWGDRLMKACYESVDQSWMSAIQWPISFLNKRTIFDSFAGLIGQSTTPGMPVHMHLNSQMPITIPHRQHAPPPLMSHEVKASVRTTPYTLHAPTSSPPAEQKPRIGLYREYSGLPPSEDVD